MADTFSFGLNFFGWYFSVETVLINHYNYTFSAEPFLVHIIKKINYIKCREYIFFNKKWFNKKFCSTVVLKLTVFEMKQLWARFFHLWENSICHIKFILSFGTKFTKFTIKRNSYKDQNYMSILQFITHFFSCLCHVNLYNLALIFTYFFKITSLGILFRFMFYFS